MVEQSGEPLLLSFLCCLPHTVQPLGHALPALCRVHVRLSDVLPRLCPSLPSLRGRLPSLVRLVHRYYGTVRLLRHVHVRRAACGLPPTRNGVGTLIYGLFKWKGTDEGEHRSIAHAPDTEREAHVPGVGRCAEGSKGKKAGAVHRFAPPSQRCLW